MPDIEFLGGPPGPVGQGDDADEELLDTGPRRSPPRWIVPLALAVLVAVGITFAVAVPRHDHQAAPQPTPTTTHGPVADRPAPYVAAAVADEADGRVFTLRNGRVYAQALDGARLAVSPPLDIGGNLAMAQLVLEPVHDTVWVVPQGLGLDGNDAPGLLEAFTAYDLNRVFRAALPDEVEGAAPFHGRLYLAASGVLLGARLGVPRVTTLARLDYLVVGLVADPTHDRLIYVEYSEPLVLRFGAPLPRGPGVQLPEPQVVVAVVDGTVWAAGLSIRGPVLYRLNRALRAGRNLAAVEHLGERIDVVGTGDHSLYLDVVTGQGERTYCLDGRTGRVQHRFPPLTGRFVTVGDRAFDTTTGPLRELPMGACRG